MDSPVASAGDIDTIQTLSTNVDFSKTSTSSETSSLPQPASSSDPPASNAIACSMTAVTSAQSAAQDPHQAAKSTLPLPAPLTASTPPVPSTTMNNPESIVEVDSIQVDMENRQKGESPSTNMAVVTPPAWLIALNMDVYLWECSDVTAWQGLIESLYRFENLNTINGVRRCDFFMDCY